ncbi:MAG: MBL fold metallo-hydrolase [Candidatus Omnitrophica bacterium]|nr:MBL fold metallo-hydrolase [Candidatus Omnitrophota bacterium]
MKIRLIAEGSTKRERRILRWGISFLVEDVLFDAFGRADIFWENIRRFRIDLSPVRHVVISHDDWDHIAGLQGLLQARPKMKVHVCEKTGEGLKDLVRSHLGTLVEVRKVTKIARRIFSTGQMRADTGRGILYEQALVIKTRKGISVITGCAHPGILRIVKKVIRDFGKNIYAVCGGFHMKNNEHAENVKIATALKALGVVKVAPLHCSGAAAVAVFQKVFGKHCVRWKEGALLEI